MEKVFDLELTNQRKLGWLAFGFTVIFTAVMVGGIVALLDYGTIATYAVLLSLGAGFVYGLIWLLKIFAIEPSLVTIATDSITVLNKTSGEENRLLFNEITSYQYSIYDGGKQLRLKYRDSTIVKLSDKSQEFATMVREFEMALARHQQPITTSLLSSEKAGDDIMGIPNSAESPHNTIREKTFFEKRISTILMAIMSVVIVWLTCSVLLSSRPIKGSLFLAYSGYISYATIWWIARKQR